MYLANLPANALENGTITLILVKNFTGAMNLDLDTNEDGIFDITPWEAIVDAVAVNDGGAGDLTYGVPVLTVGYDGLSYAPGGASRIPDGYDTDAATDWVRNDFHLAGIPGFTGTIVEGEAYNTPGLPNMIYETPPPPEQCGDLYSTISSIQGSDLVSPLNGSTVSTEGVVVGDFLVGKSGFFIQDPVGDGNPDTSEGMYVYVNNFSVYDDLKVGDHVRVRGSISEYYGLTEITVSQLWDCGDGASITPTSISLPVDSVDSFEKFESMLVTIPQALTISEYFDYDRYGEMVLTTERYLTPTAEYEPGSPEYLQAVLDFSLNHIVLDDGRTAQNPDPAIHPNGFEFILGNLFRGGDIVANIIGLMDYGYDEYRIQPIQGADYTPTNGRPDMPEDVGGDIKVASFNVLNYFTTLGSRGANTPEEFERQRIKIIAAIAAINADVVGLMEIENNDAAIIDLVTGLNDLMGADTYDYIDTGVIGTDEIKVAMIYKPATVDLYGSHEILDYSVDLRFDDSKNRPTLAQSFLDLQMEVFSLLQLIISNQKDPIAMMWEIQIWVMALAIATSPVCMQHKH